MTDPLSFILGIADAIGGGDEWENEVSDAEIEEEWDDGDDSFFDG